MSASTSASMTAQALAASLKESVRDFTAAAAVTPTQVDEMLCGLLSLVECGVVSGFGMSGVNVDDSLLYLREHLKDLKSMPPTDTAALADCINGLYGIGASAAMAIGCLDPNSALHFDVQAIAGLVLKRVPDVSFQDVVAWANGNRLVTEVTGDGILEMCVNDALKLLIDATTSSPTTTTSSPTTSPLATVTDPYSMVDNTEEIVKMSRNLRIMRIADGRVLPPARRPLSMVRTPTPTPTTTSTLPKTNESDIDPMMQTQWVKPTTATATTITARPAPRKLVAVATSGSETVATSRPKVAVATSRPKVVATSSTKHLGGRSSFIGTVGRMVLATTVMMALAVCCVGASNANHRGTPALTEINATFHSIGNRIYIVAAGGVDTQRMASLWAAVCKSGASYFASLTENINTKNLASMWSSVCNSTSQYLNGAAATSNKLYHDSLYRLGSNIERLGNQMAAKNYTAVASTLQTWGAVMRFEHMSPEQIATLAAETTA